jgi:hypothetical protein
MHMVGFPGFIHILGENLHDLKWLGPW